MPLTSLPLGTFVPCCVPAAAACETGVRMMLDVGRLGWIQVKHPKDSCTCTLDTSFNWCYLLLESRLQHG